MDSYSGNNNKVDILITAPSDNEIEGNQYSEEEEEEDDDYIYNDNGDNYSDTLSSDTNEKDRAEDLTDGEKGTETSEEKLCEDFAKKTSVTSDEVSSEDAEEKPALVSDEKLGEGSSKSDEQAQNYEIVGDRVLVEKDGKFELVDANEIKAEYFEMLGIKAENGATSSKKNPVPPVSPEVKVRERPKTTPARSRHSDAPPPQQAKRVQSSWGGRRRNDEYGNIRSPYGLTDKQLEIKRKREEAIARRKKEEEEMAWEEERRKREDAERAFQVKTRWGYTPPFWGNSSQDRPFPV